MTERETPDPPDPPAPQPLDYATPPEGSASISIPLVLAGIGATGGAIVLIAFSRAVVLLAAVAFVVLLGLTLNSRGNARRRSFCLGAWIGLGIALLLVGLCFVALARSLR